MLLSLVFALLPFGIMWLLSIPATLAVIEGQTEYLSYRSFNPELSKFSANGFRVSFAADEHLEGTCLEGTIAPDVDARISYTKRRGEALALHMDGKGGEIRKTSETVKFQADIALFADPACGERAVRKLPVWGPGRIGDAFTVREDGIAPTLLSGNLSLFGRTVNLGWLGQGNQLYPASSQSFALPPGGWLWTDGTPSSGDKVSPEQAALFGFVEVEDEGALAMRLSTETPHLQIVAPGGRMEPDRIEIGMFVQILNDPNILKLQLFIFILFFLLPIVSDLVNVARSNPNQKNETE